MIFEQRTVKGKLPLYFQVRVGFAFSRVVDRRAEDKQILGKAKFDGKRRLLWTNASLIYLDIKSTCTDLCQELWTSKRCKAYLPVGQRGSTSGEEEISNHSIATTGTHCLLLKLLFVVHFCTSLDLWFMLSSTSITFGNMEMVTEQGTWMEHRQRVSPLPNIFS